MPDQILVHSSQDNNQDVDIELKRKIRFQYFSRGVFPTIPYLSANERKQQIKRKTPSSKVKDGPSKKKMKLQENIEPKIDVPKSSKDDKTFRIPEAKKSISMSKGPLEQDSQSKEDSQCQRNKTNVAKTRVPPPGVKQKQDKSVKTTNLSVNQVASQPFSALSSSLNDEFDFDSQQPITRPIDDLKKDKKSTPKKTVSGLDKVKTNELSSENRAKYDNIMSQQVDNGEDDLNFSLDGF